MFTLLIILIIGFLIGLVLGIAYVRMNEIFHTVWLPIQYEKNHFTKEDFKRDKLKVYSNFIRNFVIPMLKPKTFKLIFTGEFMRISRHMQTPEFGVSLQNASVRLSTFEREVIAKNINEFKTQLKVSYIDVRLAMLSELRKYKTYPEIQAGLLEQLIEYHRPTNLFTVETVIRISSILEEAKVHGFPDETMVRSMLARICLTDETFRQIVNPIFAYKLEK